MLGGETPCFSTLSTSLPAPPIPSSQLANETVAESTPVSAFSVTTIVNVAFFTHFSVTPQPKPLSTGTKVDIGVGSSVAGLDIDPLRILLLRQRRRHKKELESERESSANHTSPANS
jgi:hypothetical protein